MSDSYPPGTPSDNTNETILPTSLLAGRYRIERLIGEGAFGRVYLAFDTRLRRNVAIKELLASRNTTDRETYDRYVQRFEREARATSGIQQPNVVTVYDLHVDANGNNYLVLEYVDGTNLRDLLAQVGTLPVARAVAITIDIANALEAVDEQEIVHRDVKPANIMITRRGLAKLMDFGIARIAHEAQLTITTGSHPGTPLYMSPEQSSGYGYIDGRSDLYALGLVLYEMLAGEPYGRRRQPLGSARTDLPPALVAIVDRLLAHDADARYPDADALVQDLSGLDLTARESGDLYPSNVTIPARPVDQPSWAPTALGGVAGVPSAYGGPPTAEQPGTPAYQSGPAPAAPPPVAGYPPPSYPTAPNFYVPPSGPPPKSNRGLLFGIGGAVLGVLAIVAVVYFVTQGGSSKTATATPGSTGGTTTVTAGTTSTVVAAVSTTPTTATGTTATPTAGTTSTPTRAATTPATTPPTSSPAVTRSATAGTTAQLTTWSEPSGLLKLQYPNTWTQTRDSSDKSNLVDLNSPDGVFLDVELDDPQQGTLQQEIDIIRKNQTNSTKYNYTDQKVTDVQIAGEPAKMMTYTYTDKTNASTSGMGVWWVVNHGGKQFSIVSSPLNNNTLADVTKIVQSINFGVAKSAVWNDPNGVLRAQYPPEWSISTDKSDNTNILSLSGSNDEIHIFVYAYSPGSKSYDQSFKEIRDAESNDTNSVRVYDPVLDTKIGGQAAKSIAYRYSQKSRPDLQPGIATIWLVDRNGKRYEIRASNMASHRAEIEGFVASLTFLK